MNTLVLFDRHVSPGRISKLSVKKGDAVFVFPLTLLKDVIDKIIDAVKISGCSVTKIGAAVEINLSADRLRDKYINFIAGIPERLRHNGKNIRELFSIDDYATLWWFSSVSEKNTIESEAFNRLSQLDAVAGVIEREGIKKVLFGCGSERLKKALVPYLRERSIRFEILPTDRQDLTLKRRVKEHQGFFCLKHLAILLYVFMRSVKKTRAIKKGVRSLERVSGKGTKLAFITYYPYFDRMSAEQGIFKNNYYAHLQDALEGGGGDPVWIAMSVNNASITFEESLGYFERFVKKGYRIYFLEEFSYLALSMKAAWRMLESAIKFLNIERAVSAMHTFGRYNFYPLLKDDWYESFIGERGYCGTLQYYQFRSMLHEVKAEGYVYCCEMRAWEKALISARNAVLSKARLFSYQHAAVSRMLLNYFNDPEEVTGSSGYSLPRPDKIICNGPAAYNYMKESGWAEDILTVVEAVRYSHLKRYTPRKPDKEKKAVLLAFSTNVVEGSSLLNIAYEALNDIEGIEVWIRPHPFLGIHEISRMSGISLKDLRFQVKDEPLERLIERSRVVIAGESSVSIEALAGGCEVVIVNVPECINMSPLKTFESALVRTAGSSRELRQAVLDIFGKKYDPEFNFTEGRKIVEKFFYFNRESDRPERFMKALAAAEKI